MAILNVLGALFLQVIEKNLAMRRTSRTLAPFT